MFQFYLKKAQNLTAILTVLTILLANKTSLKKKRCLDQLFSSLLQITFNF